jgi:hypothetical protein
MKNFRNLLAAVALMFVLMVGASTAKAGLLVSDFTGGNSQTPCTETKEDSKEGSKYDWGVIVNGVTGVIVNGLTGVIVNGFNSGIIITDIKNENTNCGVIVNG